MARVSGDAGDVAALAPADHRQALDLPAQAAGPAAARPRGAPADPAARARERAVGLRRTAGELRKLEITVSATLVRNVLARAGIPPAPVRARLSWRSFLRQHGSTIVACDFL